MKFDSRKDLLFNSVVFGVLFFLIGMTATGIINGEIERNEIWVLIPISLVVVFILSLYFGTSYELNQKEFIFRSGPFRGKIDLKRIKEIVKGKTLYVGFKPATASKGLIIKYDAYEDIYISPKTNESFIKKILLLKSDIKISE